MLVIFYQARANVRSHQTVPAYTQAAGVLVSLGCTHNLQQHLYSAALPAASSR